MPQQDVEAMLQKAIGLHQRNMLSEARALYEQVLEVDKEQLTAYNNLAALLLNQNELEQAESLLKEAIRLAPEYANAYNNLGMIYEKRGLWEEASVCYQAALERDGNHFRARNNLGNALKARGDLTGATRAYYEAHQKAPNEVTILVNLGNCLLELGQTDQAGQVFKAALELEPHRADLHNGVGRVLQAQGHFDQALHAYRLALDADPNFSLAHNNIGVVQLELNATEEALQSFERLLKVHPDDLEALFNRALSLPVVYKSLPELAKYRSHCLVHLAELEQGLQTEPAWSPSRADKVVDALSRRSPFYLQYQGLDDKIPQQHFARMLELTAGRCFPPFMDRRVRGRTKLRVGFISSLFRNHTVGKLLLGFLEHRDREQVEVYTYYLGQEEQSLTQRYRSASDVFRVLQPNVRACLNTIRRDGLDCMVFGELAMTPALGLVAAARVAPVQMLFWGHPVTSGLRTMDVAISAAEMEPVGGEAQYTERLLKLPGMGLSYDRPVLPDAPASRVSFELPHDAVVYLSCQSLYKYHPAWDHLYARIAAQVPGAKLVFLEHPTSPAITRVFQQRLMGAFLKEKLDWRKFCVFLPHLSQSDYFALNRVADVFLDTPLWSGGNTTLEALACDLPVVTLPGPTLRACHSAAMLKVLGMPELIAADGDAYIALAVRLGTDHAWRQTLRAQLRAGADERLFGQKAAADALYAAIALETSRVSTTG